MLGVDDWAFRKGQSYGTILVDLERRRPVDLLPDRTADTLVRWLGERPGVEVIARDRSSEYTRAIQEAAPHAREVADRWHLLHNLRQALERFFTSHHARLKLLVGHEAATLPPSSEWTPQRRSRAEEAASAAGRQRRLTCYDEVRRLRADEGQRLNILQIARRLGISRVTVRKYLSADTFPEHSGHPPVPRLLQPYEAHLERRWKEGCRNALELWREIRAQGYRGSAKQVHRWASPRRETVAKNTPHIHRDRPATAEATPGKQRSCLPVPRRLAWLLMRDPEELTGTETATLACIQRDPDVTVAHELALRFVTMIQRQDVKSLDSWIAACTGSGISWLITFGEGIAKDYDAVRAALELPWSSAQAEGQINRLKLLKRQMYGRASFPLLRSRVLQAA